MKKVILLLFAALVTLTAFSLNPVTVVSPNGGETWTNGCPYAITWTVTNTTPGTVKIELYKGSALYLVINPQAPATIGSYTWTPPSSVAAGNDYRVKITSLNSAAGFDFSDNNFSINLGNITVGSPNGGEVWQVGSTHQILWTDNICENVRIELWKGGVYNSLITASTPSTGSYTWALTASSATVPGNDYKVKIMAVTNVPGTTGQVFDFSDNNFTIGSAAGLTVITPNGGEAWIIGCPYAITWLTTNTTGTVKIELYRNNAFCLTICAQVPPNMTTYTWIPPVTVAPGSDYKIKITSLTSAGSYDFSDNNFSINAGTITVVSPNGGEVWQMGTTHQILWTDNICDNVRIELWKGGVFNSLITASTPSTGSYTWAIAATNTIVPGNDYKVKIMSTAVNTGAGNQVFDFSDNNFTIGQGNYIIVTSPNGGENWARGTTHIITWLDNIQWNVRIELWKGGTYHSLINASVPSTGSCYWAIPMTLPAGNNYKVKILAVSNSGSVPLSDFSDNYFTISGSSPAITPFGVVKIYPNPGSSLVNVKFQGDASGPVSIDIVDYQGNTVLHQVRDGIAKDEIVGIGISHLRDGNYIVVVRKDEAVINRDYLVIRH